MRLTNDGRGKSDHGHATDEKLILPRESEALQR